MIPFSGLPNRGEADMKKKMLLVRETYHPEKIRALVIDENSSLEEVVRRFARSRVLRAIFVVDAQRRLIGIVTRTDLLNYVKVKLGRWGFAAWDPSWKSVLRYLRAARAKDLVHRGSRDAYVRLDDDVAKALHIMIDHDLITVPVVDKNRRVIGDIGVPDILHKLLISSR